MGRDQRTETIGVPEFQPRRRAWTRQHGVGGIWEAMGKGDPATANRAVRENSEGRATASPRKPFFPTASPPHIHRKPCRRPHRVMQSPRRDLPVNERENRNGGLRVDVNGRKRYRQTRSAPTRKGKRRTSSRGGLWSGGNGGGCVDELADPRDGKGKSGERHIVDEPAMSVADHRYGLYTASSRSTKTLHL